MTPHIKGLGYLMLFTEAEIRALRDALGLAEEDMHADPERFRKELSSNSAFQRARAKVVRAINRRTR